MQEMMSLFSKDGKIGRWMTKRPISILVCVALIALLVVGTLGTAATEGRIKVMFLRGGGVHDWKNNTPILKAVKGHILCNLIKPSVYAYPTRACARG